LILRFIGFLDENGKPYTFQNRVRDFSDIGRFQTNSKNLGLMTKEVKSYLSDSMITGLTMKGVKTQIYQILDEKENTIAFENRVREFSDIGRFQTNSKNLGLMTKEVKSYLSDSMMIGLMRKEVDPQIYRILDENGKPDDFQNRVRDF
jgi:hypothetical protein